jgi:hypothetical protein
MFRPEKSRWTNTEKKLRVAHAMADLITEMKTEPHESVELWQGQTRGVRCSKLRQCTYRSEPFNSGC